jgi:hypothetical protein
MSMTRTGDTEGGKTIIFLFFVNLAKVVLG